MKFRPCIDIHGGQVKQIVGSSLGDNTITNFTSAQSAVAFAQMFADYGFTGGHICVLDPSAESKALAESVLRAFPKTWQIGGGVNANNAQAWLDAGADKVIITSALFTDDDVFDTAQTLAQTIGAQNLVLDLSCQSVDGVYWLMKDYWRTQTDFKITAANLQKLQNYAAEFLIHGVGVEGKKSGYDKTLVTILTNFVKTHKGVITYAGGISTIDDINDFAADTNRALDFTVGSGLSVYGGDLELDEIKSFNI